MKMDYDVIREVMLAIEEQYVDVALWGVEIEGYDYKTVAYHCNLLYEAGLISDYKGIYADNGLVEFGVSALTFEGHQFLDKIRDNTLLNGLFHTAVKSEGALISLTNTICSFDSSLTYSQNSS